MKRKHQFISQSKKKWFDESQLHDLCKEIEDIAKAFKDRAPQKGINQEKLLDNVANLSDSLSNYCVLREYVISILLQRAESYSLLGRCREAVNDLCRVGKYNDSNVFIALKNLAEIFYAYEYYTVALHLINNALINDSTKLEALQLRGQIYLKLGFLDDANKDFCTLKELDPNNITALRGLAVIHEQTGSNVAALGYADNILARDPYDLTALRIKVKFLPPTEKSDETWSYCKNILQQNSEDTQALQLRAAILERQGNLFAALQDLRKAVEMQPHDVNLIFSLGKFIIELDQQEALRQFKKILQLQPSNTLLHREIGRLLLTYGKQEEAMFYFSRLSRQEVKRLREEAVGSLSHLHSSIEPFSISQIPEVPAEIFEELFGPTLNKLPMINNTNTENSTKVMLCEEASINTMPSDQCTSAVQIVSATPVAKNLQAAVVSHILSLPSAKNPFNILKIVEANPPVTPGNVFEAISDSNTERGINTESGINVLGATADPKTESDIVEDLSNSSPIIKRTSGSRQAHFSKKYAKNPIDIPRINIKKADQERQPVNYTQAHTFQHLNEVIHSSNQSNFESNVSKIGDIRFGQSCLKLYSQQTILPTKEDTVTFIFAARKERVLLPNLNELGKKQRIIMVVTAAEYAELQKHRYHHAVEFLVIKSLHSSTYGDYQNLLGSIQARRLAAWLASYAWNLEHCIYLDDNIKSIKFNSQAEVSSLLWATFTQELKVYRESKQALIAGLNTIWHQYKIKRSGEGYCYKLFSINFQLIKNLLDLSSLEEVFILGYPAAHASNCMEDYYFQIMLDLALNARQDDSKEDIQEKLHLTCKLPLELGGLERSKSNKNLAKAHTGYLEDILSIQENDFVPKSCASKRSQAMSSSLEYLKELIRTNFAQLQKKQEKFKQQKLREIVCCNHEIPSSSSSKNVSEQILKSSRSDNSLKKAKFSLDTDFINEIWLGQTLSTVVQTKQMEEYLKDVNVRVNLHAHQQEALLKISQTNEVKGIVSMTTASGKTRVQIMLANYLLKFHPDEVVHIVTPTLQLVDQAYQEFKKTLALLKTTAVISKQDLLTVHSGEKGIGIKVLRLNYDVNEAKILIFCERSYANFINTLQESHNRQQYKKPIICLLDEFHLYKNHAISLMNQSKLSLLGFSATPINLLSPLYTYSRQDSLRDKITVPLIIDQLPYSLKTMDKFDRIVFLLKNHHHPEGQPLYNYKSIIFVNSIPEANELVEELNKRLPEKIFSALHSEIADVKDRIALFRKKKYNEPGIVVVVDMLGTGYDDQEVSWGFYLKNNMNNMPMFIQNIGRFVRVNPNNPNKIAYLLTDEDFNKNLLEEHKDELALQKAHDDYFNYNRECIYLEITNAIKEKMDFGKYQALFKYDKLAVNSLLKHLELLLLAITEKQSQWVEGMIRHNPSLSKTQTNKDKKIFNLLSLFLNEVIGISEGAYKGKPEEQFKQKLFNSANFTLLLSNIFKSNQNLYQSLTKSSPNEFSLDTFLMENQEYNRIFRPLPKSSALNLSSNLYGFISSNIHLVQKNAKQQNDNWRTSSLT